MDIIDLIFRLCYIANTLLEKQKSKTLTIKSHDRRAENR